jgi:hypothetical protein
MRAPATLLKAGLSAGAALLLLTACGGSDDEQSDAAGSASSSSSAGSSSAASSGAEASSSTSDEDVQAFCTEAESVFSQISDGLDAAQPTDLVPALDQAVAAFDQIDPPAEISADWDTAQQAFVGLRSPVAGADLTTPEGQASVQQAVTDLEGQAGTAQTNIDSWVSANCDNA